MTLHDTIIVGSGPAGTCAARALRGCSVLMLDVGHQPPDATGLEGNLYELRRTRDDLFEELIGREFEGLHNVYKRNISLKLKAPYMSYIVRNWAQYMHLVPSTVQPVASFALGGLANAWGAGVFRFSDRDLQGFPIEARQLEQYYDDLTAHVGVSGTNDDLVRYFGEERGLLPPIRLTGLAADLLAGYRANCAYFQKRGMTIGLSRLAVLTVPNNGRVPYQYDNIEIYKPYNTAIYNPVFTLNELVGSGQVMLRTGYLVKGFCERASDIEVTALNLSRGAYETFCCRRLVLAAGTLGTTKIVLESYRDYRSELPILDNPMVCIPLIRLDRIGQALEVNDGALGQLNLVYEDARRGDLLQAGVYGTTGPLRSDVLFQLPLSIAANLTWIRQLSPAMLLLLLFYPGVRQRGNYIRLRKDGALDVNYEWQSPGRAERQIIRVFRKIGYRSAKVLCQYPPMGSSLHYAGTLPMKANPSQDETESDRRLYGPRGRYVADGACFSELPAKNLTFTIMANADRKSTGI